MILIIISYLKFKTFIYKSLNNYDMVKVEAKLYGPLPVKVRFKGEYDFDKVYSVIQKWFKTNRFKWYENLYKDKPSGFQGREIEINLYGHYKKTEYFKHTVTIRIHTWEQVEKEVIINGKKHKIAQGKLHITVNGSVISDYRNKFPDPKEVSSIGEKVYGLFGKVLHSIKKNEIIINEIGTLDSSLQDLSNQLKHALGMESKL